MSSSAAAAAAAELLLRRSSQRCVSLSIARDGGATASASGRCIIAGRSLSNLHRNHHQRLSTTAVAALESATSPLQRLFLDVPRNCSRGFAGSRPFSSSTAVTTPSSSPSPAPSEPSPSFVRLNNIFPSPGSKSQPNRVGRGIGSGRGKTSTRGHKGQKARSGATPTLGFEGGQTPLSKRLPRRGFHNPGAIEWTPLNVGTLQRAIEQGKLLAEAAEEAAGAAGSSRENPLTMRELAPLAGARANGATSGIKLLGKGRKVTRPIHLEVSAVSLHARQVIEAAGGSVSTVYFNALGLRALLRPGWPEAIGRKPPGPASPPPKRAARFEKIGVVPEYAVLCAAEAEAVERAA